MHVEHLDWLAKNPRYTQRFAIPVGKLCRDMPNKAVAEMGRLHHSTVKDLDKLYMQKQVDLVVFTGRLLSNALVKNAIRPFAVGRRNWLSSDTPRGARASATCYSLIETAKANNLEPYDYLVKVLQRFAAADTLEKIEALLPWNVR